MAIEEGEREEMNCTNFQMFGAGSQKVESNWSAESSQRNIGAHSSFTVTGMVRSSYSSDFGLQHLQWFGQQCSCKTFSIRD